MPTYVFAWLDELKAAARARGADLIDLGIGNPDQPTPPEIIQEIARAYADPATHGYPPFTGAPVFRNAVATFMQSRFGVQVDPDREVLCVSGAKEGLAFLTMAFIDDGAISLVPDIYYPVHARATWLAGGDVHFMPLRREHGFLPRFDQIPDEVARQARILIINYPHNPTGAVATRELYEEAVAFCTRHGIVLVSDLAYSEITFGGFRAPSALEIPGARDVTIELHSFSKSFNMAGSRIGFAVGNADLVHALHSVRTNMGYGTPVAIQRGAALALARHAELTPAVAARYGARAEAVAAGFRSLGWDVQPPRGSMFIWLPTPAGFTSQQWTEHLIDRAGVVVTPGNAFGPGGEGSFRVSLVAEVPALRGAIERLRSAGIGYR
jgi:LL-diaminopimelate aminotransferase